MVLVLAIILMISVYAILFVSFAAYLRQLNSLKNELNKYKVYLNELRRRVDTLSCMRNLEDDTDNYPKTATHVSSPINVTDYLKSKYFKNSNC